jgi:hypothetical protein
MMINSGKGHENPAIHAIWQEETMDSSGYDENGTSS